MNLNPRRFRERLTYRTSHTASVSNLAESFASASPRQRSQAFSLLRMTAPTALRIARRRMRTQHLAGPRLGSPQEVVRWFGAVQSQEYGPAKWSLGQRTQDVSDTHVEAAVAEGSILRTHILRPTWHFVLPADIRWMVDLTAPRVRAQSAYYLRKFGLDKATLGKSSTVIERALRDQNHLTRKELKGVLDKSGVNGDGLRLGYMIMHAELDGLICSGPRRGKQHTYALLDERAPTGRELSGDAALAELTLRYFTSHGPATIKDFAWWSSLKTADIKRGLEIVGPQLVEEELDGVRYWSAGSSSTGRMSSPKVDLLQPYDEYVVAYKDSRHVIDVSGVGRLVDGQFPFGGVVMLDSQFTGFWKWSFKKDEVLLDVALHARFSEAESRALSQAASAYGRFIGLTASVETSVTAEAKN
jgi:Winged helix DNA-binding domain